MTISGRALIRRFKGSPRRGKALYLVGAAAVGFVAAVPLALVVWLFVRAAKDAPAVLAAGLSAVVALSIDARARRAAARQAAISAHRQEMAPTYVDLVRGYVALLPPRGSTPPPRRDASAPLTKQEQDLAERHEQAAEKLLIWGSPQVVKAWIDYRASLHQLTPGAHDPWDFWKAFDALILAFRRDLGHTDDIDLEQYDLVRLFIDDVDAQIAREHQR